MSFEEAWKTRLETRLGDLPIWMVSKDLLVRNKLAAAPPQDIADAARLQESD